MPNSVRFTLSKAERLNSMVLIGRLFNGAGNRAMSAFPLRAVFATVPREADTPAVRILVSVPKRKLRHAVERNRVKRQIREAYRLRKQMLVEKVDGLGDEALLLAFVWLDSKVRPSKDVDRSMSSLLNRIKEVYETA